MTIEPPRIPVTIKRTSRFRNWSRANVFLVFDLKLVITYNVQEDHNYDNNRHFHFEQFDFTLFLKLPLIVLNVVDTFLSVLKT